ncbi:MAG: hypothetical protein QNL33_17735 [Akkermansiaceae bacterium]|jgi:hypothetical protein
MTRRLIISLCALSLLAPAYGMGKKKDKNTLTFHLQGDQTDGPKMVFPLPMGNQKGFFRKSPLTFTKEILAYQPFFSDDGTAGATFAFSQGASTRIAALTTQNQGKWIVAMLNGRPVDFVRIDRPVQDGRLVIWRGIKESEIFAFDYVISHIGEDRKQWKARLKAHAAAKKAAEKAAKERQAARNRRN